MDSALSLWGSLEAISRRADKIALHTGFTHYLVLVPPRELRIAFDAARQAIFDLLGWSLDDAPAAAWEWLEDRLARHFVVSGAVIAKRGPADGLWEA